MIINPFDAKGSNQVQIELYSYFLYLYCLNISVFHTSILTQEHATGIDGKTVTHQHPITYVSGLF